MKDLFKIVRYSWDLKRYYLVTAALVVMVALLNQANPFLLKYLVDAVVKRGSGGSVSTGRIALLLGLLFAAGVLVSLVNNVLGHVGDILASKLQTLLSRRYYDHLLELPLEFYDNEITGRITGRLDRSIAGISELIQAMANSFIGFFLTSAFTLIILARYSPLVALLLAALFPLYICSRPSPAGGGRRSRRRSMSTATTPVAASSKPSATSGWSSPSSGKRRSGASSLTPGGRSRP